MTRSPRVGCAVCGLTVKQHAAADPTPTHPFAWRPPVTSGTHRTPRLDLKVPDPDGRAAHWRDVAERQGVTLGELTRRALESYCYAADDLLLDREP